MGKRNRGSDWCSNGHRMFSGRRLRIGTGITGKSQAKVGVQLAGIFRGIISPSLARVETTQERGGIQFGRNEVEEEISRDWRFLQLA